MFVTYRKLLSAPTFNRSNQNHFLVRLNDDCSFGNLAVNVKLVRKEQVTVLKLSS